MFNLCSHKGITYHTYLTANDPSILGLSVGDKMFKLGSESGFHSLETNIRPFVDDDDDDDEDEDKDKDKDEDFTPSHRGKNRNA